MNRLKLWLYMVVVLGAGAANVWLLTLEAADQAAAELHEELQVGAQVHRAREQLLASQAGAVAAVAVRDQALLEALAGAPRAEPRKKGKGAPPPEATEGKARFEVAEAAARGAVERAAAAVSVPLPATAFWAVATPDWLAAHPPGAEGALQDVAAFLREAAAGKPRRGYALVNDGLWFGVSMPAGEGSALVLFLPVDATWAAGLKGASGCDVTIDAGTPQLITTARPEQAQPIAQAAKSVAGRLAAVGVLGSLQLTSPIRMQAPLLLVKAPQVLAQAIELQGLPKAYVVLSIPTALAYSGLAHYQWVALEVLAGLLLVGLLLGLLLKTEVLPQVPANLVAVASRIERGDFTARAPEFLGALGTLSSALNKAAEAAQAARQPAPSADPFAAPPPPPAEPEFDFSRPSAPQESPPAPVLPAVDPFAPPPGEAAAPSPAEEGGRGQERTDRFGLPGQPAIPGAFASETFTARPVPRPAPELPAAPPAAPPAPPAPEPAPALEPAPELAPGGTSIGIPSMTSAGMTAVSLPAVGAPAAGAGPEDEEEAHWRAIHAEFLETRARCGESIENLGFERFRPKLQKNKETLVQKYGCRTVRFSVYVKEGKAALKATPVR